MGLYPIISQSIKPFVSKPYTLHRNKEYPYILGAVDAELTEAVAEDETGTNKPSQQARKGFLEVKMSAIYWQAGKKSRVEREDTAKLLCPMSALPVG
jgi:hypothetical protein